MNKNYDVLPHGDQWEVRREGADRASALFDRKTEALERATELAKSSGGELRIHGQDGRIQNSNSFGNDPNPPKDKKH